MAPVARAWADALDAWSIPDEILAAAPEPPWGFLPGMFEPPEVPDDTPSRRRALTFLGDEGAVLDVGCGAGAAGLALVPHVSDLTGVDENPVLLERFVANARAAGVAFRTHRGTWPLVAADVPVADVAVSHHVVYNVRDLVAFVVTLTGHARKGVVIELGSRHPMTYLAPLWRHFWGVRRPDGPSARNVVDVVRESGIVPEIDRVPRRSHVHHLEDEVRLTRRRLCLPASRDDEVAAQLARLPPLADEAWTLSWRGDG
jgi:SAM-dependent methyltransferase